MRYINTFKLIHTMFEHKPLDSRALLADVDQHTVMQALNRSKGGMPKSIQFTNVRMEHPALAKMRPGDKERLWEIYERVRAFPNEELPKLLELQQQYPHVPPIYNYIGIAYACSSQEDKYFEILLETNRRFPEYLFGKTALADYYLTHHEHKKVPKILDKKFELWQHYPTIELFHVSEVRLVMSTEKLPTVTAEKLPTPKLVNL